MLKHLIGTLYAYNTWANELLLDTALPLNSYDFSYKHRKAADSIRDTFVHIMSAQQFWLLRWQAITPDFCTNALDVPNIATLRYWVQRWSGILPTEEPNPGDFPDILSIRACWRIINQQTDMFVRLQDNGTLDRIVEYINVQGVSDPYPLWQMIVHQTNHATHHRSEIAVQLTELGRQPPSLEFISYIDTHPQHAAQ